MIEALEAALEDLAGTDPAALGDAEGIERLHACAARLDAVVTRATAARGMQVLGGSTRQEIRAEILRVMGARPGPSRSMRRPVGDRRA